MIARAVLDLVFPRNCAGCGKPVGDEGLHTCWECLSALWSIQFPFCSLCGNPVFGTIDREYVCSLCCKNKVYFDRARSAAHYDGKLAIMLRAFKYAKATHLARDLAMILRGCVEVHYSLADIDGVLSVPLHHRKERERTYNQAQLLASELAMAIGKPLLRRCLVRSRATASQTELNAVNRRKNVHGAFETINDNWIQGRRLLLVDDIMTTGATANECARVLKEAGAVSVRIATVGRGMGY